MDQLAIAAPCNLARQFVYGLFHVHLHCAVRTNAFEFQETRHMANLARPILWLQLCRDQASSLSRICAGVTPFSRMLRNVAAASRLENFRPCLSRMSR
jgi:hypothetical protein